MWTLLAAAALAAPEVVRGDLGAKLDEYLTRFEAHGYSGAVLVADRDGILLERGYGLADRERARPVEPDTVFTCGSITKQVTAAAIVKLQAQGELSVDDWLADHFDEVPEDKQRITLHDLLTHASGLRSDFAGDFEAIARDDFLRRVMGAELLFEPGTGFSYSNSGYSLLAAVIEQVTGRSYEEYLREELLLPAGMRDTGYRLPGYADQRLAIGYTDSGRWGTVLERALGPDGPSWGLRGNGGMHTTVGDMYRWHLALEGEELFSDEDRALLYGRHNPEGPGAPTAYGYGWSIGDSEDGLLVAHNGGNGVFGADFLRFLDAGITVCMTSSSASFPAYRLSEGVGLLARGREAPLPPALLELSPEELERYAGRYEAGDGGAVLVEAVGGARARRCRPAGVRAGDGGPATARQSRPPLDGALAGRRPGRGRGRLRAPGAGHAQGGARVPRAGP